jgi:uncharacterized protein (DUF924 family)
MALRPGLANEVLTFWFGDGVTYGSKPAVVERVQNLWFSGSEEVDSELRRRFGEDLEAVSGEDISQITGVREKLVVIVLLDQFSRNICRDTPGAFAQDALALQLSKEMLRAREDRELEAVERVFVYMPLEHSENKEDQALSVEKFQELLEEVDEGLKSVYESFLDYAVRHKVIIDRFGRFPHRNEILGRESTAEEIEFLKEPGSSF